MSGAAQFKPRTGTRRIKSGASFISGHKPPDWLIQGIVQKGRLYACTSPTNHGKTAVWLFNACMVHAGRDIQALRVERANVLYLAGENPTDVEARLLAMQRDYNLAPHHLPYVLGSAFPLDDDEADALMQDIKVLGQPIGLIVGDTAFSFFPGDDDNDNVQAAAYARTLRLLSQEVDGNPAVVMLAHPTKRAGQGDLMPRGGGAFLNELDGNLTIWKDGETARLHWQHKIRGPDFQPLTYLMRGTVTGLKYPSGDDEPTIVAEPIDDASVANRVKQLLADEDVVLRDLKDMPGKSIGSIALDAGWVDQGGMPQKSKVFRILQSLAADKLITQGRSKGKWTITSKGEQALDGKL